MRSIYSSEGVGVFTYKFIVTYNDISTAATTGSQTLWTPEAGEVVQSCAYVLGEEFDGGATSELIVTVGDAYTKKRYIDDGGVNATSIHADATPVAKFSAIASTGYVASAIVVSATFTSTGANLDALDQGRITFLFNVLQLPNV